jgi:hypothetical protein
MTTGIQELDPDVLKVLERIVSRFLNKQRGTPIRPTRTSLLSKRNVLGSMLASGYLKCFGDEYLPTFKLVADIAPDIGRIGFSQVNAVLAALRNLYIAHEDKNEFPFEEILSEVRRLAPGLDENDVVPGLFLANDLGYFASWSTPSTNDGTIDVRTVQLAESILDFTSAEETWAKISAERNRTATTIFTPSETIVDLEPEVLSVDFSFVNDKTLRRIIERDYLELEGSSPSAMKSRIVLAGGLIEALLLDCLLIRANEALSAKGAERDRKTGKTRPLDEWHLSSLIDVSKELGVISEDAKKHSSTIREYRNLVHPGLEKRGTITVREHVANIAGEVLRMVIADVRDHPPGKV